MAAKTKFYDRKVVEGEGKTRMYDAVEELILERKSGDSLLRFMSLPGKRWRFEEHIGKVFADTHRRKTFLTGFERQAETIMQGTQNVPRTTHKHCEPQIAEDDYIPGLDAMYFGTNKARWIHMDVNDALTLTPSHFEEGAPRWRKWIEDYCMWNAVWLDYCGPATDKMAAALSNLHFHCDPTIDEIPVAVTVLKGREVVQNSTSMIGFEKPEGMNDMMSGKVISLDRQSWLEYYLGGGNNASLKFETLNYFEYRDAGTTMCNILGVIKR